MLSLMERLVKPKVITASKSSPMKSMHIDLNDNNNLLPTSSIKVGFGAKALIKNLPTVKQIELRTFFDNARAFLKTVIAKLKERSR